MKSKKVFFIILLVIMIVIFCVLLFVVTKIGKDTDTSEIDKQSNNYEDYIDDSISEEEVYEEVMNDYTEQEDEDDSTSEEDNESENKEVFHVTNDESSEEYNTIVPYEEELEEGVAPVETGDTPKFSNWFEFLEKVPDDKVELFLNSVPDDFKDEYPDMKFISYDEDTFNITAENNDYVAVFKYNEEDKVYGFSINAKE